MMELYATSSFPLAISTVCLFRGGFDENGLILYADKQTASKV